MYHYGATSLSRLESCDERLQAVFNVVIEFMDVKVLEGHRPEDEQDALFYADPPRTKVKWPDGKHNPLPSLAIDAVPYPINWKDRERFTYLAGLVRGIGAMMGYTIRWGGDWDRDGELDDNKFDDLPHFELVV